jgi:ABC-type Fe2+-enterobactin transport system substrate-binding protein
VNVRYWLRFQLVDATLCRQAIAWQKFFLIKGIAKDSPGRRALVDGKAGYLAQLTARSPVETGVPAPTNFSRYPLASWQQLLRQLFSGTGKNLWAENQAARF